MTMSSKSWAGGSTRRWREIRARVLQRNDRDNDGMCTINIGGVCTGKADCVHHVLGRAVTGDDVRYLAAACSACNGHIGQPNTYDTRPQPKPISSW